MEKRRIIFDLNGTLFETLDYESRLKIILKEGGISYSSEELKRMLTAMLTYEKYFDHYTIKDYAEHLSDASGLPLDIEFIKYFLSRADILAPDSIEPEIVDILEYLKMRYDLAILTNYFAYAQFDQMAYRGISHYFSEVYGGEKVIKPHRDAFLSACGIYKPEECIMIGDDLKKDIEGALKVPMDSIYFNRNGTTNNNQEISDIRYLKKIL